MAPYTVLLFGPQALSFDDKSFAEICGAVRNDPYNQWVIDVVSQLPETWATFVQRFPQLDVIKGRQSLEELSGWLSSGEVSPITRTLPNILLSPLVVISQLTQFTQYLRIIHPDAGSSEDIYSSIGQEAETVGFCTGLLSALAVATATGKAQFEQNAATAVRLATLIGAFVDAQETSNAHKASISLATAWNSLGAKQEMAHILNEFPEVLQSIETPVGKEWLTAFRHMYLFYTTRTGRRSPRPPAAASPCRTSLEQLALSPPK